jgi:hypothetical protein
MKLVLTINVDINNKKSPNRIYVFEFCQTVFLPSVTDSTFPKRQSLPSRVASQAAGSPVQQTFRQALQEAEELREQLAQLRASQAATRQLYWQQVGPLAAAAVAARRALYAPLETALTSGYLNRAEEQQVTELLVHNARNLQERFGEDEAELLARYAPAPPAIEVEDPVASVAAPPELLPHEQAAARARRLRPRAVPAQVADAESHALLHNTKVAYRQLARLHHPDRAAQADAAVQQAQTAMMQRITAAYAAGDLAALLSLLANSSNTDAAPSAEAEALLVRYTAALAHQRTHLIQQLQAARRPDENAPWSGTAKQQKTRLREIKRSLRAETEYLEYLVRQLHEPSELRQLLRQLSANGQDSI